MKTLDDILKESPTTLEGSPPLPAGTWEIEVTKPDIGELTFDFGDHKQGDSVLNIYFKPVRPIEVDPDDLEQCENWRNEMLSLRIFPEEIGDRFCDNRTGRGLVFDLGLDPKDFESTADLIVATKGCHCLAQVKHSPNKKNPDKPYANIASTAAL